MLKQTIYSAIATIIILHVSNLHAAPGYPNQGADLYQQMLYMKYKNNKQQMASKKPKKLITKKHTQQNQSSTVQKILSRNLFGQTPAPAKNQPTTKTTAASTRPKQIEKKVAKKSRFNPFNFFK